MTMRLSPVAYHIKIKIMRKVKDIPNYEGLYGITKINTKRKVA